MADFLITARITLPDGLIAQAQALAKVAEPLEHFSEELSGVLAGPVKVDIARVRAAKGSFAAANPDKPKRERKAKPPASQADLGIPPKPGNQAGADLHDQSRGAPAHDHGLGSQWARI